MKNKGYEVIEIDPATGEFDQLLFQGTMRQCEKDVANILADFEDDWNDFEQEWPTLMIRPAECEMPA